VKKADTIVLFWISTEKTAYFFMYMTQVLNVGDGVATVPILDHEPFEIDFQFVAWTNHVETGMM
jgi:hypothetical protein